MLLVVFLVIGIKIFSPLLEYETQYGMQEQTCRMSLALSKHLTFPGVPFIEVGNLCKAQLIKLNNELIEDYKTKSETKKQATMRYMAEKMDRCQKIYDIQGRDLLSSSSDCYVCYGLQADAKDPLKETFTPEEFTNYITKAKSPRGKSYIRELLDEKQTFAFKIQTEKFEPATTDYAEE